MIDRDSLKRGNIIGQLDSAAFLMNTASIIATNCDTNVQCHLDSALSIIRNAASQVSHQDLEDEFDALITDMSNSVSEYRSGNLTNLDVGTLMLAFIKITIKIGKLVITIEW